MSLTFMIPKFTNKFNFICRKKWSQKNFPKIFGNKKNDTNISTNSDFKLNLRNGYNN